MNITSREKQVLDLISCGHTIKEIANKLYISPHTAVSHKKSLFEKLKALNAPHLISTGFKRGLLPIMALFFSSLLGYGQSNIEVDGDAIIKGKIEIGNLRGNILLGVNNGSQIAEEAFHNILIGQEAGNQLISGDDNIFLGYQTGLTSNGFNNVHIGTQAGAINITGALNTFIGSGAGGLRTAGNLLTLIGANATTTNNDVSRSIALGYDAEVGCSFCMAIGEEGDNALNVGIGITTPTSPLHIKNKLISDFNPAAVTIEDIDDTDTWEINTFADFLNIERNGVTVASINPSTGVYTAGSDIKLKENVKILEGVLPNLESINTYYFNYKSDPNKKKTIGVIAQEVQKKYPELISKVKDHLSVNYSGLGVIAIQAIKEQQELITSLIESLKKSNKRLTSLENELAQYSQIK